jgi:predicted Zn-dependent peptidase
MADAPIETFTLANGMRVVTANMPAINSVSVLAMVGVGSRFENRNVAGISHFLEHLPFKGTKKFPTSMDVATAIDGVGGKHNAMTSKDYTGYWAKVASGHITVALDFVSDLLLEPQLRPDDIERERGVIIEEINMYEDQPQAKVSELFDELVFSGSGLAIDTAGYKETVGNMSRADFLNHYQTWYNPENVVIGVVGKLRASRQSLQELLETYFNKGEERVGGGKKTYGVDAQIKPRAKVFYKDTEQAHFYLGYPGIGWDDPDRYALTVLMTILGGNSSSRMFNEIREKRGLAYYAYASADMYAETGSVYALEGVAIKQAEEAVKVTLNEFGKMIDAGVSDEEVARAKEYVVGKMSLDLEDSANMANMVVRRLLLEGKVVTIEDVVRKIRAVTKEEINTLSKRLFEAKKLNFALIGPFKKPEKFEKLLGV